MTVAATARTRALARINPIWPVLAALILAIVAMNPDFLEPQGHMNVLRRAAPLAVLAAGQVFVLTSGGFDLSAGSTITLTVVGASMLLGGDASATGWVIPALLGAGALIGLVVAVLRVPSLIATLETMSTVGRIGLVWSGGAPRGYLTDAFRSFGRFMRRDVPVIGLLPAALLVLIVVGSALWWLMHRTSYGRLLHAIGDNPEAARLAGVPVARVRVLAFGVSSLSAVVAGILLGGGPPQRDGMTATARLPGEDRARGMDDPRTPREDDAMTYKRPTTDLAALTLLALPASAQNSTTRQSSPPRRRSSPRPPWVPRGCPGSSTSSTRWPTRRPTPRRAPHGLLLERRREQPPGASSAGPTCRPRLSCIPKSASSSTSTPRTRTTSRSPTSPTSCRAANATS